MAITDSFKDYIADQLQYLERIGHVSIKKMFGGAGIYFDGLIFGVISDKDVLYFKVDDSNRQDYEAIGMGKFKPFDDKPMVMPYYEVPEYVVENRERLAEWARKAIEVSQRTPPKKKKE
jgi:DNA transformation protein